MNPIVTRVSIVLLFVVTALNVNATIYQTLHSGNFSSAATWKNGLVPPTTLGATDTVYLVGSAPNIVMDRDLILGHSDCVVYVYNPVRISDNGKHFIAVQNGVFGQNSGCRMSIDSFYLSKASGDVSTISGTDTFNKLTLAEATYKSSSNSRRYVKELLHLKDGECYSQYQIAMDPNATIFFSDGGGLSGSQTVDLTSPYYLKYENANTAPASRNFDELKGSNNNTLMGIEVVGNVFLDLPDQTLTLRDELKLTSGSLRMSFNNAPYLNLHFRGAGRFGSGGTGTFYGTDSMQMYFYSDVAGVTSLGTLRFASGGNKLGILRVELAGAASGALTVESDMYINSHISLGKGHINMKNHKLDLTQGSIFGIISGGPDGYVMLDTGGSVSCYTSTAGVETFPIGTVGAYLPMSFEQNGGIVEVSVEEGVLQHGTNGGDISGSQPVVNATWTIHGNLRLSGVRPGWQPTSEKNGFNRNKCYVSYYENGSWSTAAGEQSTFSNGVHYAIGTIQQSNTLAMFDVNTNVSVEELLKDGEVALYPNPAANTLNLDYSGNNTLQATVMDIAGKQVTATVLNNGTNSIDVSALANGAYFLHISGEGVDVTRKFMKQ